jgi:hypothetical protein
MLSQKYSVCSRESCLLFNRGKREDDLASGNDLRTFIYRQATALGHLRNFSQDQHFLDRSVSRKAECFRRSGFYIRRPY